MYTLCVLVTFLSSALSQTVLEGGFLSMLQQGTEQTEEVVIKLDHHIPKSELAASIFEPIPNVRNVTIQYAFNSFAPGAFANLKSVRYINLDGNKFVELPTGSFYETSAEEVHLYNCAIGSLKPGAFYNTNIRILDLKRNRIGVLQDGVFNALSLQELDLSENGLEFIDNHAFANMANLRKLVLHHNRLTHFQAGIVMPSTHTVDYLDLAYNELYYITHNSFDSLYALEILHLEHNTVSKIYPDAFANNRMLKHLFLSSNQLRSLEDTAVPPLQLQTLHVQSNRLTYLSTETQNRLQGLKEIGIYRNPWGCESYKELKKWIRSNGIIEVPGYELAVCV